MDLLSFYGTQAWKDCRAAYKSSRGGLCERCLSRGLIVAGSVVHHKIELTDDNVNDPSVSLNWENLELLCRDCHEQHHQRSLHRWKVDELGHIVPVGE